MAVKSTIDEKRALVHLMDLLAVEGLSGREGRVAELVKKKLRAAGVASAWMRHDRAHRAIHPDWEIGNLIVRLPGTGLPGTGLPRTVLPRTGLPRTGLPRTGRAPRRLFMGHLDTVPLCRGAVPVRRGARIVAKGPTALGGDNRSAVACIVTMAETLLARKLPHPPLTLLFTVGEEVGLLGARHVKLADLGKPAMGFNIDSGDPFTAIIGAIGAERWEIDVIGRSSHAGVHPEQGISAALIASIAIAGVAEDGWFGRIRKGAREGTSNVGIIRGGEATNQVTDRVFVKGESRSHDRAFCSRITRVWHQAFERAAKRVRNTAKEQGRIEFRAERDYEAFRIAESSPPVRATFAAIRALGAEPKTRIANGGLDANYLNAKGIPTVTLGAGQHDAHTTDEYIDIAEYLGGCRLAVEIASAG